MHEWAVVITKYLSSLVEILTALVIAVALVRLTLRFSTILLKRRVEEENQTMRIEFGSALIVALELLLAADILATAIALTWDDIGKLAAIAALRTLLNYFSEKELQYTEEKRVSMPKTNTNDAQNQQR